MTKKETIFKVIELALTGLGIATSVAATIKAAKLSDAQIEMLSEKTSEKVVAKLNEHK